MGRITCMHVCCPCIAYYPTLPSHAPPQYWSVTVYEGPGTAMSTEYQPEGDPFIDAIVTPKTALLDPPPPDPLGRPTWPARYYRLRCGKWIDPE